jgi:hypothetical protein
MELSTLGAIESNPYARILHFAVLIKFLDKKEDRELHSDESKKQDKQFAHISQLIWDDNPQSTGAVFNQPRVR